jgi:hypothetical protein
VLEGTMPEGRDDAVQARLDRLEERQEALIRAVDGQTGVLGMIRDQIAELLVWAQQEPASDVSELLSRLVASVDELQGIVVGLGAQLPGAVADAVRRVGRE